MRAARHPRPRRSGPRLGRLLALAVTAGGATGYLIFDLIPTEPGYGTPANAASTPAGNRITGRASVIDGDTIEIHGTRIRFHGIDAPESGQTCRWDNAQVRCGQRAATALSNKIGSSTVVCDPRDMDRYGRVVAVCYVGDLDLNGWMVSEGWALAYRRYSADYVPQEEQAGNAKNGMWKGEFVAPWDWRRGDRREAIETNTTPSGDCMIKGNISVSSGERIYHMPSDEYYPKTRITTSKGERWFCTEVEARAAGWRRARR